jgi:HK97 family phage major capsid protein
MKTGLFRTLSIQRAADGKAADDNGVISLAISSEAPYERWFGIEILSHDKDAVDLTRLADGRHPLLLNHDRHQQIGVITEAKVDGNRVLRGQAKFSRSPLGQEIRQDVDDEIRTLVSVGYFIEEIQEIDPPEPNVDGGAREVKVRRTYSGEEFEREMRERHGEAYCRAGSAAARGGNDKPPTFLVTRWQPFEASIVSVPADVTVGVGRAAGAAAPPEAPAPTNPNPPPTIITENRTMTTKDPAAIEAERRDAILTLGEQYAKYVEQKDIADALRNGRTVDQFKDLIIQRMESKHSDASSTAIGLTAREVQGYSLGRALVAAVTGDWRGAGFEQECSRAVEKLMGRAPEGFYVPFEAFNRDFNVGTGSEAGNLVQTSLRGDLFADYLRNKLVMGRLGARILTGLTGNLDIPRKSVTSTVAMLTEIGSASETNPNIQKATLSPKRMGAYVEVSKQALIQSAMALEGMLRDDLVQSGAVLLEYQCINGAGTGAEITGLRNTTGIGTATAGANGAAPTWAHLVELETVCANANAEPDSVAGYLINTKLRGKLKQTQMGTNLPFIWQNGAQPVNGYRAMVSNNVPSNLTKGTSTTICSAALFGSDWSDAVIGLFGAPDITVDPYTKADTGQVKITLNQFADMKARQPASFAKIEDLLAN